MIEAVTKRETLQTAKQTTHVSLVDVHAEVPRHHVLVAHLLEVFEAKPIRTMASGLAVLLDRRSDPLLGDVVLDGFDQFQNRGALANAIGSPSAHQLAPLLQEIAATIGGFRLVLDGMGQRGLCQLT